MISEFIYTSSYSNTHITQTLAVAPYGWDTSDVDAIYLVVTATMQMMIIVIIQPLLLLVFLHLLVT